MNEIELTTQNVLLRNRAEKAEREQDAVLIELQNLCEVVGKQSYTFTSRSVIEAHRQARRLLESLSPATESVAGSSEQVRYLPTVETKAKELVARLRDRSKLYPEGIADAFDAAEATAAADTIQALLDKLNDDESELEERPVPDVRQPL